MECQLRYLPDVVQVYDILLELACQRRALHASSVKRDAFCELFRLAVELQTSDTDEIS